MLDCFRGRGAGGVYAALFATDVEKYVLAVDGVYVSFWRILGSRIVYAVGLFFSAFASIFCAVLVTMIAVGVQNTPPKVGPTVDTNLITGFTSASNVVFAFGKLTREQGLRREVERPRLTQPSQPQRLLQHHGRAQRPQRLHQGACLDPVTRHIIVPHCRRCHILLCRGRRPLPGTGSRRARRLKGSLRHRPTDSELSKRHPDKEQKPNDHEQIIIAGVLTGHIACKSIYVRVFAGTNRMQKRDFVAVGSWVAIGLSLWIVSWIIAEAIPVFNNLLSLMVSALLIDAARVKRADFLADGAVRQLVLSGDSGDFLAVYEL